MSLAWIPQGILLRIQKICCKFLWNGHKEGNPFTWVIWSHIVLHKKLGGWGLKYLPAFAHALAAKLGWLLLKPKSLSKYVVINKYISPHNLMDWVRLPAWKKHGIFVIWRVVLPTLPTVRNNLTWRINNGTTICIRSKSWIGCGNLY